MDKTSQGEMETVGYKNQANQGLNTEQVNTVG